VIRSFRDAETEKVFLGIRSRKFPAIEKIAIRKLFQLHAAKTLHDLRAPGNSLEALKDDRAGQHSIRINDRYRLCFIWEDGDAYQVEITDYH
jgi:toxin HigB-1